MLGKLFHYEIRYSSPILLILHGFLLLGSLILYGIGGLPDSMVLTAVTTIGQLLCVILAICTFFYTYLGMGIRFYRTVFSRQGYLTNTLPVTSGQILLSRFLATFLWGILDFLILFVCLSLASRENLIHLFLQSVGQNSEIDCFFLGILLLLLSSYLLVITILFCCVAMGNLFSGHKIIGAVISYFGLQTGAQLISFLPLLFVLKDLLTLPSGSYGIVEFQSSFPTAFHALQYMLISETVLYLLTAAGLYWLTWYLMDKKLNLE